MLQKIADLKGRLTSTEQQLAAAQAQVANLEENASVPSVEETNAAAIAASEHQISQVLIVAQQSADKLVADARANAERIRNEADQKAREVIRQALAEKQTELDEIDRLKQSREDFRAEYRSFSSTSWMTQTLSSQRLFLPTMLQLVPRMLLSLQLSRLRFLHLHLQLVTSTTLTKS